MNRSSAELFEKKIFGAYNEWPESERHKWGESVTPACIVRVGHGGPTWLRTPSRDPVAVHPHTEAVKAGRSLRLAEALRGKHS